jgi:hypothetical protein
MNAPFPPLYDARQMAEHLGVCPRVFLAMVRRGDFPKPLVMNNKWRRWTAADLQAFLDRLEFRRTG